MSGTIYLTKEGLGKLKEELNGLVQVKRPELAQKIKSARDMGDISENSEYDAAREEQAFIEGRISELEEIVKNAVVSSNSVKGIVSVGSKVTVHIDGDKEICQPCLCAIVAKLLKCNAVVL